MQISTEARGWLPPPSVPTGSVLPGAREGTSMCVGDPHGTKRPADVSPPAVASSMPGGVAVRDANLNLGTVLPAAAARPDDLSEISPQAKRVRIEHSIKMKRAPLCTTSREREVSPCRKKDRFLQDARVGSSATDAVETPVLKDLPLASTRR